MEKYVLIAIYIVVSLASGANVKQESSNCTRNGDNGNYHPQYQSSVAHSQNNDFLELRSDRCFG